ncbi:MAG TPA: protein phosphatase 2C domain-containing protein [Planctomycetaceae bacterium]|nr:protein phosphatase 2C domain-containing protein [Planctomycetaceae bacterium]
MSTTELMDVDRAAPDLPRVEPPGVETFSPGCGTAAVHSSRCPGKPTPNEDAFAVVPFGGSAAVLIVADGLGGGRGGELASAVTVQALELSLIEAVQNGQPLRTAILDGIESANRRVRELALGAASTLAIVEVQDGTARPYHVGDSTILIVGQRGKVKVQTVPHSPVGYAVESGLLDAADAMHHEDRHVVSNVVGSDDMRIEIGSALSLSPRDTIVLASDGLSDNLHVEEIVELARKGPLPECVRLLASAARDRMQLAVPGRPSKPDDLTIVAFRLNGRVSTQTRTFSEGSG